MARSGPPFAIYTLAKAGALWVSGQLDLTVEELGWRPSRDEHLLFLEHTLRIVDFRLALEAACWQEQITLAGWIGESSLRKQPLRVDLTHEDGQRQAVSVVPDGVYTLRLPNGHSLTCALEIDRATSTLEATSWQAKSWRRKVLAYQSVLRQGLGRAVWDAETFIITTCCSSRKRAAHMREVCERAGGDHNFWFAAWADVAAAPMGWLTQPIWQVADHGTTPYTLAPHV
jgi:hypothetical protein